MRKFKVLSIVITSMVAMGLLTGCDVGQRTIKDATVVDKQYASDYYPHFYITIEKDNQTLKLNEANRDVFDAMQQGSKVNIMFDLNSYRILKIEPSIASNQQE